MEHGKNKYEMNEEQPVQSPNIRWWGLLAFGSPIEDAKNRRPRVLARWLLMSDDLSSGGERRARSYKLRSTIQITPENKAQHT